MDEPRRVTFSDWFFMLYCGVGVGAITGLLVFWLAGVGG